MPHATTQTFLPRESSAWVPGPRTLNLLQLMRFPNTFTAAADIVAGYLIVSWSHFSLLELFFLCVASSSIYAAGCVLNDICDRRVDALERPSRPIPSGKVSLRDAALLCAALFGTGLLSAYWAGLKPLLVACLLVVAVAGYDTLAKKSSVAGPAGMAACRALNLVLGMSPGPLVPVPFIIFPVISFVYVFSLTTLSRFEVAGNPGQKAMLVFGGWVFTILALTVLARMEAIGYSSLIYLVVFSFLTGRSLVRALATLRPRHIGMAVKTMILCLPLLDAVYASGALGWPAGIPVTLLALPSLYLSRHLYVT